ncbi:MAG: hypothetical protein M1838_004480, partial [Thelocarpon superellum]
MPPKTHPTGNEFLSEPPVNLVEWLSDEQDAIPTLKFDEGLIDPNLTFDIFPPVGELGQTVPALLSSPPNISPSCQTALPSGHTPAVDEPVDEEWLQEFNRDLENFLSTQRAKDVVRAEVLSCSEVNPLGPKDCTAVEQPYVFPIDWTVDEAFLTTQADVGQTNLLDCASFITQFETQDNLPAPVQPWDQGQDPLLREPWNLTQDPLPPEPPRGSEQNPALSVPLWEEGQGVFADVLRSSEVPSQVIPVEDLGEWNFPDYLDPRLLGQSTMPVDRLKDSSSVTTFPDTVEPFSSHLNQLHSYRPPEVQPADVRDKGLAKQTGLPPVAGGEAAENAGVMSEAEAPPRTGGATQLMPRFDRSQVAPGHRPHTDPSKPWIKINYTTAGKNVRPAKIENFQADQVYDALIHPPAAWSQFQYTGFGELETGKTYSALQLRDYLYNHPLHIHDGTRDAKHSRLRIWIQRAPADSARRKPTAMSERCRWKECPCPKNTIRIGHFRVCFDELSWLSEEGTHHDPYVNAGYVHLYCMEKMIDFPTVAHDLNVQPDTRSLSREFDGVNRMGLKHEIAAAAHDFLKACADGNPPSDYPRITADYQGRARPHAGTLNHGLQVVKVNQEQPCRHRKRLELGDKSTQNHNHLGDLEVVLRKRLQRSGPHK